MEDFKVLEVNLEGSNLIEASAGTGKTFSLAILALRLIIEKDIPINKILMVTFTNAAVAELEERIRLFVRLAYKVVNGEHIDNSVITSIIKNLDIDLAKKRLSKAKRELKETSIQTIHSFCQHTLTEFAFEADQTYGVELIEDVNDIILDEVNNYWRTYITELSEDDIAFFLKGAGNDKKVQIGYDWHYRISRSVFTSLLQKALDNNSFKGLNLQEIALRLEDLDKLLRDSYNANELRSHIESFIGKISGFTQKTANSWIEVLNDAPNFYKKLKGSKAKYINEIFGAQLPYVDVYNKYKSFKELNDNSTGYINESYRNLIKSCKSKVRTYLDDHNLVSYDDLIKSVHKATMVDDSQLIKELQKKYQAVFIDEFQDTDKLQYEIFNKTFAKSSILFYIGDPKQSIYAWRKADLNVYFDAREKVQHRYTMGTNFRSSQNYVKAMNEFFKPTQSFNTFSFPNNKLDYYKVVSSGGPSTLIKDDIEYKPLSILTDSQDVSVSTANLINSLLIETKLNDNNISPLQIGVLVRKTREAKMVKESLQKLGIPAVTIDEQSVFDSEEAEYIQYILETVIEISWKGINKALLNPFTAFKINDLLSFDSEKEANRFRVYRDIWLEKGVYPMLLKYVSDYNVKSAVIENRNNNGERIISNLFQIIELLQKEESKKKICSYRTY